MEWNGKGQKKRRRYLGWNEIVRTGDKGTVFGMEWNGRGQNKRGWYLGRNGMGKDRRKEDGIRDEMKW